jgi:hypothetical protein
VSYTVGGNQKNTFSAVTDTLLRPRSYDTICRISLKPAMALREVISHKLLTGLEFSSNAVRPCLSNGHLVWASTATLHQNASFDETGRHERSRFRVLPRVVDTNIADSNRDPAAALRAIGFDSAVHTQAM